MYTMKSYTCLCCLDVNYSFRYMYCTGCCEWKKVCENCYSSWPIMIIVKYAFKSINPYRICSTNCILKNAIYFSKSSLIQFSGSNFIQEQQEEILNESRKNAIKSIIQPLNYFINDILCEIMTY